MDCWGERKKQMKPQIEFLRGSSDYGALAPVKGYKNNNKKEKKKKGESKQELNSSEPICDRVGGE
jgi:hypothetical protein